MKIMFRLIFCSIACLMTMPLFSYDQPAEQYESAAMAAFSQDLLTLHAIKQRNKQSRNVHFINNIQQATSLFKTYDSLSFVDPICTINGKTLHANDECDLEIENNRCLVTIRLHPGFAQHVTSLDESFWGLPLRYIEKYLLRSRSFTFICDLSDCDSADTATLFFNAYSQSETGNYTLRMRSPIDLEISLPSPVEY